MKARIVRIGNSQGIRIPKPLLELTGLDGEVQLKVEDGCLVISGARGPRDGWLDGFKEMARRGDDKLLDAKPHSLSSWDEDEWEW